MKNVSGGYARNFLLPRGLAVIVTPQILKEVEQNQRKREGEEKALGEKLKSWQEKINRLTFEATLRAKNKTEAFGSLAEEKIIEFLAVGGIEILRSQVEPQEPLKTFGEHQIKIKLGKGIEATLKTIIQPEPQ